MARHMITVTIACLLVSIATAQLCPEEEPFSVAEAFKRADNVLLGTDVTDLAGCQATDGGCSRRQIKFQVTYLTEFSNFCHRSYISGVLLKLGAHDLI